MRRLLLAPLLLSQAAWCEVYRWTDENGQVQFGDRPPTESAADAEPVELSLPPADPEVTDAYSIQNQLERMEQARAEREAARPEPPPPAPEPAPPPAPNEVRTYWGPGYYWPPPRPHPPIHPPLPHPPGPHPQPRPLPSGRLHLPGGIAPAAPSR